MFFPILVVWHLSLSLSLSSWIESLSYFIACFSYGPCQTPTLGFCVQRYLQINTFKPEKFWALRPYIIQGGYELKLEWERNRLFDSDVRATAI